MGVVTPSLTLTSTLSLALALDTSMGTDQRVENPWGHLMRASCPAPPLEARHICNSVSALCVHARVVAGGCDAELAACPQLLTGSL